ncbi:hypothetical protein KVT40_002650 [Elsinoe batatas]|uniref:Uncharacterized protein n=1 Tax=Elsinoe batatas TaxID=2601811 RepID=A0A8K0PE36_9PEZI|nr:hypothetical protein KVT40_002650 [Elsinoe batatas]
MKFSTSSAICLALSVAAVSAHTYTNPLRSRSDGFKDAQLDLQADMQKHKDNPDAVKDIQQKQLNLQSEQQASLATRSVTKPAWKRDDGFKKAQLDLQAEMERNKDDPEAVKEIQLKQQDLANQKQDSMMNTRSVPFRKRADDFQEAQVDLQAEMQRHKDDPDAVAEIQKKQQDLANQKQDSQVPARFRRVRREDPPKDEPPKDGAAPPAPEKTEAEKQLEEMQKQQDAINAEGAKANEEAAKKDAEIQEQAKKDNPGAGARSFTVAQGVVIDTSQGYDSRDYQDDYVTVDGDKGVTTSDTPPK